MRVIFRKIAKCTYRRYNAGNPANPSIEIPTDLSNYEKIQISNEFGWKYLNEADFGKSKDHFKEAFRLGLQEKSNVGIILSAVGLAECLFHLEDYQMAIAMNEFVIKTVKDSNVKRYLFGANLGLGNIYRKLGDFEKSKKCYTEALSSAETEEQSLLMYENMAIMYTDLKNYNEAKKYFDLAFEIALKDGVNEHRTHLAGLLFNYGILELGVDENKAKHVFLKCIALADELGHVEMSLTAKNIIKGLGTPTE